MSIEKGGTRPADKTKDSPAVDNQEYPQELQNPSIEEIRTARTKMEPSSENFAGKVNTVALSSFETQNADGKTDVDPRLKELRDKDEKGTITDKELSELSHWTEFPNNERGRALLNQLDKEGTLSHKDAVELNSIRAFPDSTEAAKLFEKAQLGTITKEERAKLIAWQEFEEPETKRARELVVKEIDGRIKPEEHAELAAWRQFTEPHQDRARELAKKEFLNQLKDDEEKAELKSWRKFPFVKNAHDRELFQRELLGKGSPQESQEITRAITELPSDKSIVSSMSDNKTSRQRVDELTQKFRDGEYSRKDIAEFAQLNEYFPDKRGSGLLAKSIEGALSGKEAAELLALRKFPDNKHCQQLMELERSGQITPTQKVDLESWREFAGSGPHFNYARQLSSLELSGKLTQEQKGSLAAYREFHPGTAHYYQDYRKALEYAQREYLGKLSLSEANELSKIRMPAQGP